MRQLRAQPVGSELHLSDGVERPPEAPVGPTGWAWVVPSLPLVTIAVGLPKEKHVRENRNRSLRRPTPNSLLWVLLSSLPRQA